MNKKFVILFSIFIILFNQIIKLNANDDTYINSSNITYNEKENIVELSENSKINFKNTNILIDKGIIDYNKNKFEVFGNFYLYEELTILSGQNLKGNTNLDTFSANNVSYVYNDELKIDSDNIKRDKNLIYFYNNFLTPCELDGYFNCPTWSLRIDKTEYNIKEDKFTHFDTFLQIADYKVLYLPFFTHYGVKASRQKGFLTPFLEFKIGGNLGVIAPYYLPLNETTDLLVKPYIYFDDNFIIQDSFKLNTTLNKKTTGGDTSIEIENIKKNNNSEIKSSIRFTTKNVIDKNRVFSSAGLFTNSVSSTRSTNEDSITFEDIYIKLENYNLFSNNDYLNTELSSIASFDSASNKNYIPISPSINYINLFEIKNKTIFNELNFISLRRNDSNATNPSESLILNMHNEFIQNYNKKNIISYNKVEFLTSLNEYRYNFNTNLNSQTMKISSFLTSDIFYQKYSHITPRLKFVLPIQIQNTNKEMNEDSNSITFNYHNQFADNRFFGNDLIDSTPRIIYGIENFFNIKDQNISININQSYDFKKNNSYANLINQQTNFSDYSIESQINTKNLIFKIDARLDSNNFSKREMNYSFIIDEPLDLKLSYNETKAEAFKTLSSDTKALNINISKNINENLKTTYETKLDIINDYSPFESSLNLSLFDECSQLDLTYSNLRFNDNFNTIPEEKISISFKMDYLGFFSYEETNNLFYQNKVN